jgi:hypothetical protein
MSVIYLKHAEHGGKVAISEQEAAWDESKGWKRFDPTVLEQPAGPQEEKPVEEVKEGPVVQDKPAKKRQYNRRA